MLMKSFIFNVLIKSVQTEHKHALPPRRHELSLVIYVEQIFADASHTSGDVHADPLTDI